MISDDFPAPENLQVSWHSSPCRNRDFGVMMAMNCHENGVSINGSTPIASHSWMVYMENPMKMDDLGVPPF